MVGLSRLDYAWYRKLALPIAVVALLGLMAVLVPGVGTVIGGARRWIFVGGQSITPSELAKMAAVMLVAALIAAPAARGGHARRLHAPRGHRHRARRRPHHAGARPGHHAGAGHGGHERAGGRRGAPAPPVRAGGLRGREHPGAHRGRALPHAAPHHVPAPLEGRAGRRLSGHPVAHLHRLGAHLRRWAWATPSRSSAICPSRAAT